jgi:hypothetical protein
MKELDLARALHDELDTEYNKKLFRAVTRGQSKAIKRYTEKRRINDGAYFLIIFGTFERYVTDRADTAVKARTNRPLYKSRRAWDTLLQGSKLKTTFLNRVRVVIDQQGPVFAGLATYYNVRNDLAHSGVTTKVFSIPAVVTDLKNAVKQMKA